MVRINIKNRIPSFLIVLLVYLFALAIAVITYNIFNKFHPLISTFIANIASTLSVWLFGLIFSNSSLYDPYWSVAPMIIVVFWIAKSPVLAFTDLLLVAAIAIWGIRLTFNWAIRWKGIRYQDWRYGYYKARAPKFWFFTNLFGINIMPTIIVYLALIPAYFAIGYNGSASILTFLGFIICLVAVFIQFISDRQMDLFKKNFPKRQYIDMGLWKYSRHPNYFGEVSFWWGIWLMQIGIVSNLWVTVIGPVAMTLLFLFISIPLMESHILESRPGYDQYRNRVSMILPWFRGKETADNPETDG